MWLLTYEKLHPTFGRVLTHELSAANREMLFIPEGFAHGFLALEEPARWFI